MDDRPDFSIPEVVLSGLFIGGAISSLIYTGKLVYDSEFYDALESGGFTIMLFAAVADPINYIVDCLTFPFHFMEPSGHQTKVTMVASAVGLAMFALGWFLNNYYPYAGA
jgi:hypothetical protein